jgi:hypothetical protein
MYMVLLQQFLKLHDFSVNHSEKAPIAAKRIINFMDYMTNYVTRYMHRGLFERPKKIWTLMLAMTIQQIAGTLSATYAGNLLKAGGALDAKSEKPVPAKWYKDIGGSPDTQNWCSCDELRFVSWRGMCLRGATACKRGRQEEGFF